MNHTKAYSAASATSLLASTTIPRRDPTERDVQIEILFCGICHSDLHQVRNEWSTIMPTVYPIVPGHEIVGRVTKVGSAVTKHKPGELVGVPVTANPTLFSVISNYYGGDGKTNFALPDLRGRTPVGSSTGQPGASYGAEQIVLTVSNLPSHTHAVPLLDFDRWITSFGLSGAAASFTADADADADENGFEWATGTNPTNAQSFDSLTISSTRSNVLIGFTRNTNATDVIFSLLRSTNLATSGAWTAIATNSAGVWTPSGIVTESGSNSPVNVTISDPLTNAASASYHLQINWP
jgi:microcystin-dependent protein